MEIDERENERGESDIIYFICPTGTSFATTAIINANIVQCFFLLLQHPFLLASLMQKSVNAAEELNFCRTQDKKISCFSVQ